MAREEYILLVAYLLKIRAELKHGPRWPFVKALMHILLNPSE